MRSSSVNQGAWRQQHHSFSINHANRAYLRRRFWAATQCAVHVGVNLFLRGRMKAGVIVLAALLLALNSVGQTHWAQQPIRSGGQEPTPRHPAPCASGAALDDG